MKLSAIFAPVAIGMSSFVDMRAASGSASAAGTGLVTVSTTHAGGCESFPESLEINHDEARFVRLQKGLGVAAKLQQAETADRGYQVLFVTLTYRPSAEWRGDHVGTYLNRVRDAYRRDTADKLRYVWVAETTKAGVVHYHVIFWVKKSFWMPKADKRGWWPHGMTKTETARLAGGSVVYLMSYVKKHESKKDLPNGARVFGIGGLSPAARNIRRWVHLPAFLQARYDCRQRVGRAPGGGWVDADGCLWPSEWGLAGLARGCTRLVRLRRYSEVATPPRGPFSWLPGVSEF